MFVTSNRKLIRTVAEAKGTSKEMMPPMQSVTMASSLGDFIVSTATYTLDLVMIDL